MYKVFINEKKLLLSKDKVNLEKTFSYKNSATLEMAIDRLKHTSCKEINIYHPDIHEVWETFQSLFKNIAAAGGVVSNGEGKILFIKRLGKWDLPKGKTEKGEKMEETAVREVEEETCVDQLEIRRFIGCTYHTYQTKKHTVLKTTHWFDMLHHGNKKGVPQTEEGITAIDWKTKEQIAEDVLPNTFQNIISILKSYRENTK